MLKSIVTYVNCKIRDGFVLFSDLPGHQSPNGGSIPTHILVTPLRPDIFLVNELTRDIVVFELTCPWEKNIVNSHTYKEEKYAPLVADLSRNYNVSHFSVEIAARGLISKPNKARLKSFAFKCCNIGNAEVKRLIMLCSKASLLSSFSIFQARNEPSWASPAPLVVRAEAFQT